jgi:hypothetical protein
MMQGIILCRRELAKMLQDIVPTSRITTPRLSPPLRQTMPKVWVKLGKKPLNWYGNCRLIVTKESTTLLLSCLSYFNE